MSGKKPDLHVKFIIFVGRVSYPPTLKSLNMNLKPAMLHY